MSKKSINDKVCELLQNVPEKSVMLYIHSDFPESDEATIVAHGTGEDIGKLLAFFMSDNPNIRYAIYEALLNILHTDPMAMHEFMTLFNLMGQEKNIKNLN